jgi:hypothetical protein
MAAPSVMNPLLKKHSGDWMSRLLLALWILITAPIAGKSAFAQQTPADRLKAN